MCHNHGQDKPDKEGVQHGVVQPRRAAAERSNEAREQKPTVTRKQRNAQKAIVTRFGQIMACNVVTNQPLPNAYHAQAEYDAVSSMKQQQTDNKEAEPAKQLPTVVLLDGQKTR